MSLPEDGSPRVALVTGGRRGLGLACARELRERGFAVHVASRSADADAPELAGFHVHRADAADPGDLARLVGAVVERDGRLDVVVHSVGEFETGSLEELSTDRFRALLESNAVTAHAVASAARPALRASRGRLVLFGTAGLAGHRARTWAAGYSAAKSALLVLARSLAVEEAPHGMSVFVVSPGVVPHEDADPTTLDPAVHSRVPQGRPGTLEELARTVGWLATDAPEHATGTEVELTGAWLL